jgi:hypothetical protein
MTNDAQQLLNEIEDRESRWRRRSVYFSIIPLLLVTAFVAMGVVAVSDSRNDLETLTKRVDSLRAVDSFYSNHFEVRQTLLRRFQAALDNELARPDFDRARMLDLVKSYEREDSTLEREARVYLRVIANKQRVDLRDTSTLRMKRGEGKRLLLMLAKLQGIQWQMGGGSPSTGFDANGLIRYVLQKVGGRVVRTVSDTTVIEDGDIVNLVDGHRMFYFNVDDVPFYVGMTEVGVYALDTSFAEVKSFDIVAYK